jgi:phospholipid N-methyltransferase
VTRYSSNVTVYPTAWGYTASGAMDWIEDVNPFREIERECKEEVAHQLDLENTFLYQFGLDSGKLFYQFNFYELSLKHSDDIIAKASQARDYDAEKAAIDVIPFDLSAIVNALKMRNWEPAALAGLVTLCTKKFGYDEVAKALAPIASRQDQRERAIIEWSHRAQRQGDLAVMSARYPSAGCSAESKKYVESLMDFVGRDIDNRNILEIGSGIGRVTKELSNRAASVTCVDLSGDMIARARENLQGVENVVFFNAFIQDTNLSSAFDLAITSLVLIHIPDDHEFSEAVNALKRYASTIFLFEHIDPSVQVSSYTKPRSERDILCAFDGYSVERRQIYKLFDDTIIFLKLVKSNHMIA